MVWRKKLLVKFWESMMCVCVCVCVCVWSKIMLLILPRQGTTPQILKLKFPVQTSGPKHKCEYNKLNVIKLLN
jgi:hypothetical protein